MLYSIIPPILIVLSLIGIIVFIMKKAPLLKKSIERDLSEEKTGRKNIFSKFSRKDAEVLPSPERPARILAVSQKVIGKSKMFLPGLRNKFSDGWRSLKDRREKKRMEADFDERSEEEEMEPVREEIVKEKEPERNFRRKSMEDFSAREPVAPTQKVQEERQDGVAKKDLFEKILIDRIATNPKDIEAYERLGEYYLEIESWGDAKECFKQVLKLNPRNMNVKIKMRKLERLLAK
jgi:tetratricopeptide (TPR) repeat protein